MRRRLGGAGEFCLAGIRGLTNEWTVRLNRFIFRRSRLIVDVNAIEGIADDDFLSLNTLASANQGRSAWLGAHYLQWRLHLAYKAAPLAAGPSEIHAQHSLKQLSVRFGEDSAMTPDSRGRLRLRAR
jgi:hypothetical protein